MSVSEIRPLHNKIKKDESQNYIFTSQKLDFVLLVNSWIQINKLINYTIQLKIKSIIKSTDNKQFN